MCARKKKKLREPDPARARASLVCLLLWLNLSRTAQIAGAIWMAAGIAFGAWKTRGFRGELVNFDIPAEEEA